VVIPGYTALMKMAISLPNDIFERASRRATDLGMSRSEFFARAADRYLDELDATSVTKQIDAALADVGNDQSHGWAVDAGRGVLAQGTDEW
jgi:metal-responsive CopG/Arc/MetJ family transcriptional regulator